MIRICSLVKVLVNCLALLIPTALFSAPSSPPPPPSFLSFGIYCMYTKKLD